MVTNFLVAESLKLYWFLPGDRDFYLFYGDVLVSADYLLPVACCDGSEIYERVFIYGVLIPDLDSGDLFSFWTWVPVAGLFSDNLQVTYESFSISILAV